MPLPIILGVAAIAAGGGGIVSGISGVKKMKDANDTMEIANRRHKENIARFELKNGEASTAMDRLGETEMEILNGFKKFSNIMEKIQGRPEFKKVVIDDITIPKYDAKEISDVSVGAGVLLGGLGSAAAGTAGGFAAAGATTSAVMALGTASTGTAIASLSGAAATNATLAALGGGALGSSALAGGMALGSTILGISTLGVGLLVGGAIFNFTGSGISNKADEAYSEVKKETDEVDTICMYLDDLTKTSADYRDSLSEVRGLYNIKYNKAYKLIIKDKQYNWNEYSDEDKLNIQNLVLLVGLLYKMCQVNLVSKSNSKKDVNKINKSGIKEALAAKEVVISEVA